MARAPVSPDQRPTAGIGSRDGSGQTLDDGQPGRHRPLLQLRDRLAQGALEARELVETCLTQIGKREPEVQAWAWLDGDQAVAQATRLDAQRKAGRPIGPLHGLPVAIKDIIDTAGVPTENGCALDAGRVPVNDAVIVERLKAAGAIIMGKSVTAELAFLHPGKTRNPHNRAHTPGGSSSGSAAAVAADMVPLGVGTQTGGSVIRPAAYCGVVGYKPSFGAIPRTGILSQSPTLDTVGVFAASVDGAALLAETLYGHDRGDPHSLNGPFPRLLAMAQSAPPMPPVFAFVRGSGWDQADADNREACEELVRLLGEQCFEAPLPSVFDEAVGIRQRINFAEMAKNYHHYQRRDRSALSDEMRAALDEGNAILARDYLAALDWPRMLNAGLDEVFQRCDAILAPATLGAAPADLSGTGSAVCNSTWTLCGTPVITLPVFESAGGLPMGIQLIGPRGADGRLLRTAQWLADHLAD